MRTQRLCALLVHTTRHDDLGHARTCRHAADNPLHMTSLVLLEQIPDGLVVLQPPAQPVRPRFGCCGVW